MAVVGALACVGEVTTDTPNIREKLAVFISYSRKDFVEAERLHDALVEQDFEAYLDKHDILPGEAWQERLGTLIEGADSVVFLTRCPRRSAIGREMRPSG